MAKNYVPELLAPAGSIDALKAAVNAGADAVYISGKKFGARKFAANFSDSEIEEGLEYAKLRGVKVYVTVNTLIKDSQMPAVLEYVLWLYKTGVDAVIVQDIGVAYLIRKLIPELPVHSSTQMTIHNISGVEWASKFGFKRVVLSRELGISEVEMIKSNTVKQGIEIEIFGHGALCYCYSGQCLLSSFIGGRSGNRGMCAQPCRKEYTLLTGKMDKYGRPSDIHPFDLRYRYLLSTKDLSVYKHLDQIANSKVDSLKVEGRMRSAEYVAIVIKIYRKALDSISKGKWKINSEDISKLKLAFNRDFTGGYLLETNKTNVMGRDASGNRGLYIGLVQKFDEKTKTAIIKLENEYRLKRGDGVVFKFPIKKSNDSYLQKNSKHSNRDLGNYGMALEDKPKYIRDKLLLNTGRPINPGSKLFLTRSISLNHEAAEIIKTVPSPSIPIDIVMNWDNKLKSIINGKFIGFDGREHKVSLKSSFRMEKAIKKPLNIEQIESQLKKTGQTPFILGKVEINYPGDLFCPTSKLNQFRREFLKKSEQILLNTYQPSKSDFKLAQNRYEDLKPSISTLNEQYEEINEPEHMILAAYTDSIDTVKGALDGGAKRIYLEINLNDYHKDKYNHRSKIHNGPFKAANEIIPDLYEENIISILNYAEKLCDKKNADFIWKWPQITHQYQIDLYKKILKSCHTFKNIMVDGLGAGEVVKEVSPKLNLSGSAGLNVWNKHSVVILSNIFDTITPSAELSQKDLKTLISHSRLDGMTKRFEIVVQGNVDTLISKDCLLSIIPDNNIKITNDFWGIQDGKKRIFPIKIDSEGRTHILNSVELCLIDHLKEIYQLGMDGIVVDLRNKTYAYANEVTYIYSKGLEYTEMGISTEKNMDHLKSKIKDISTGGITTGNFLKGIKEK
jgi:putative protease